jgi:hypothetical protein
MILRKSLFSLCVIILCLPHISRSETLDIQNLNIQARSIGLGESAIAVEEYAASDNPAALGQAWSNTSTSLALSLSQARLAYDRYGYQILALVPLASGSLGIRFDQLIFQNTSYYRLLFNPDGTPIIDPITNQQAAQLTYDTQIESLFGLAYGLEIIPGITLGAEAQAIHVKVGENYAWGFDATAGMDARILEKVNFGFCIKQANGNWRSWRNPYQEECGRPIGEAGIAWTLEPWHTLVTGTIVQTLEWKTMPQGKVGLEYSGFKPLTLRAGWDADHMTLGAGFVWKAICVDYAAIIGGVLYDANRITLKISF